ncbi:MAG: PhoU domain-containing protein [Candidatus Syntropharchaeales archaeon]
MEARKVQITGKSTYMITLPKKWAIEKGLKAGTLIRLSAQSNGSLMILPPDYRFEASSKSLNIGDDPDVLRRNIIGAYVIGYQLIELKGREIAPKTRKEIQAVLNSLIGYEIIEETENKIIARDLLDPNEVEIEKGFKRMYAIVSSMLEDLINFLNTKETGVPGAVIERDVEVDRIYLLISKQFISKLKGDCPVRENEHDLIEDFHHRMAAENLERIADHTVKIANTLSLTKVPDDISVNIQNLLKSARSIIMNAVRSLNYCDTALANTVMEDNIILKEQLSDFNRSVITTRFALPLELIKDSISRIGDYATNIAELTIDLSQR